jgi:probable HAF family extracellular repeat protein
MQRVTSLEEITVPNEWNGVSRSGVPVTLITLLSATMAIGMLACTSEQGPTEPSTPSLAPANAGAYTAVDLGTLGGSYSEAKGINPRGQVVGYSLTAAGEAHAFLWAKGVMGDLGTLEGDGYSFATGINPTGQVVGLSSTSDPRTPDGCCHAFIWEKGVMTYLGTLGGTTSEANAINPEGQVVGHSTTTGNASLHAFLWEKGVMTDLGTLPGGTFSVATAINPAGQVVGYGDAAGGSFHAFLWNKGVMTDIGTAGDFGLAYGINPRGQVVGGNVLWEKGVITDLGAIEAQGISPASQVVGYNWVPSVQDYHAFIWTEGLLTDLGTLGGTMGMAFAINPAGQVAGRSRTAAGQIHATLWTDK